MFFCIAKDTTNKMKDRLWDGRKYFQTLCRGQYRKYIRNPDNQIAKRTLKTKSGQRPKLTFF
jgi:hypothetical protein